ncbi:LPS export ABC transporter periplasmic protein LptC [Niabella ginsenosidivorans]|uniref:LPS export ABC transporter periplasmic protein LptC n=2 Tax=Niabella ginsenosidivorans TaxID=1176587 RepID=A0A1A9I6T1_9BACT|nr:LPS export ABC transporter periplasmic protein LptC [Niabella ginsenosidivorans]
MTDRAVKVEGYLSQGGKIKARLTAPVMLRVQADTLYTEFPKTLHVDFYNDSAKVDSKLDSKYGKYMESLNMIYLRDSVRVISIKGDTLYCQDLWWDQNKQLFYTDKPAKYNSQAQHLQGDQGLEATQDLKNVKFKSGHGQVQPGQNDLPGQGEGTGQADSSGHKGPATPMTPPVKDSTPAAPAQRPAK